MINIEMKSRSSAMLSFDKQGIDELLIIMNNALDNSKNSTSMKGSIRVVKNEVESTLSFVKNEIAIIELDADEIEYVIERLNKCKTDKQFYPAEVSDVRYKNNNLTIYAIYSEKVTS